MWQNNSSCQRVPTLANDLCALFQPISLAVLLPYGPCLSSSSFNQLRPPVHGDEEAGLARGEQAHVTRACGLTQRGTTAARAWWGRRAHVAGQRGGGHRTGVAGRTRARDWPSAAAAVARSRRRATPHTRGRHEHCNEPPWTAAARHTPPSLRPCRQDSVR
jgi:hypothetical protein